VGRGDYYWVGDFADLRFLETALAFFFFSLSIYVAFAFVA
jgi:hypothetical protein